MAFMFSHPRLGDSGTAGGKPEPTCEEDPPPWVPLVKVDKSSEEVVMFSPPARMGLSLDQDLSFAEKTDVELEDSRFLTVRDERVLLEFDEVFPEMLSGNLV
jgi:hypothetical protein